MHIVRSSLAALTLSLSTGVAHSGGAPAGGSITLRTLPRGALAKLCLRLDQVNFQVRINRLQAIDAVEKYPFNARSGIMLRFIEARVAVVHLGKRYLFDVRDPLWVFVVTYKRAFEPTLFFVNAQSGRYVGYVSIGQPCLV